MIVISDENYTVHHENCMDIQADFIEVTPIDELEDDPDDLNLDFHIQCLTGDKIVENNDHSN